MKRRLFLIFLIAAMVITAAACKTDSGKSSESSVSKETGGEDNALPPECLMGEEHTEDICISAEITEYELETLTEQGYRSVYNGRNITADNGVRLMSTKKAAQAALHDEKICPRVNSQFKLHFPEKVPGAVTWYEGYIDSDTNKVIEENTTGYAVSAVEETVSITPKLELADLSDFDQDIDAFKHYGFIRIVCDFDGNLVEYTFFPGNETVYFRSSARNELWGNLRDKLTAEAEHFAGAYVDDYDKYHINLANSSSSSMSDDELTEHFKGIVSNTYSFDVTYHIVRYTLKQLQEVQDKLMEHYRELGIIDSYIDEAKNQIYVGYSDKSFDREKVRNFVEYPDALSFYITEIPVNVKY